MSPYAVSKLAGEHYCRVFTMNYGLETVCLRYFNIFGPRQDPTSDYAAVVPKFVTMLLAKKRPVIFGDGKQSRDFTYVANVVEANLLACRATRAAGEFMNIACGDRVTVAGLAYMIGEIVGHVLSRLRHGMDAAEVARPAQVFAQSPVQFVHDLVGIALQLLGAVFRQLGYRGLRRVPVARAVLIEIGSRCGQSA